jgi:hypothetical protein
MDELNVPYRRQLEVSRDQLSVTSVPCLQASRIVSKPISVLGKYKNPKISAIIVGKRGRVESRWHVRDSPWDCSRARKRHPTLSYLFPGTTQIPDTDLSCSLSNLASHHTRPPRTGGTPLIFRKPRANSTLKTHRRSNRRGCPTLCGFQRVGLLSFAILLRSGQSSPHSALLAHKMTNCSTATPSDALPIDALPGSREYNPVSP